jgi:hypothetical protein
MNLLFADLRIKSLLGALSALVKDSTQFKQHEKWLLKVDCKLTIIQTTTILKICISWCGDSQSWRGSIPEMAGKSVVDIKHESAARVFYIW